MAIQSKPSVRISDHGIVRVEVFMEYHDDDWRVTNDDGDPDDFRVIRWFGTNHSPWTFHVQTYRANGAVRWVRDVAPGGSFTVNAGGPVKYEGDIPAWSYWWSG